ncbi:hypothetical protein [Streptomyces hydrogenans]|uniref:hypothetical protein n=1 Tax=Streptomyces hydrogenans TaxID=1873719 RepID=UPI003812A8AA
MTNRSRWSRVRQGWKTTVTTVKELAAAVDQVVTALVRATTALTPTLVLLMALLAPDALAALLGAAVLPAALIATPVVVASVVIVLVQRRTGRTAR